MLTLVPPSLTSFRTLLSSLISSFPLSPFSLPTIRLRSTLKILTAGKQNVHQSWHASQMILRFSSFSPSLKDTKFLPAYTSSPVPYSDALCHQDSYPNTTLTLYLLDPAVLFGAVNHPFLQESILFLGSNWVHLQSLDLYSICPLFIIFFLAFSIP